jgi:hypothetical protein
MTINSNPAATDFIENIHTAVTTAHEAIIRTNEYTTIQANRRRRLSTFAVGDLVPLSTRNLVSDTYTGARKLMPKFCGPFAITAKINDVTYRLDLSVPMLARGIHNAFHAKLLRPYHPDTAFERPPVAPPPIQFPDGHTEYEVEKLIRYRLHRGKPQYLVGKAMVTTTTLGYLPLTSAALISLPNFIEPRTALPQGGDDDRFHLSMAMYRQAISRYATFRFHLSWPYIDMPRFSLQCHPHYNT